MALNYKSDKPSKGLAINRITDPKFRSEIIVVRFIIPLDEVSSQKYSTVTSMLSETCRQYPKKDEFAKRLAFLYGATVNSFAYRTGKYLITGLSVSGIADRYTINGENVSLDYAKLLMDCIFEPNITDGKFPEELFEQKIHELKNKLINEKNNRHAYAVKRARQIAFEGELSAISPLGSLDNADKLTNEELVRSYHELLENAIVSVSFAGKGENEQAQKFVTDRLTAFVKSRKNNPKIPNDLNNFSPVKNKPRIVSEKIEQSQSKLVMFFKTDSTNLYANTLACEIYGGTPFSRLFLNVREKMSLCYYCNSVVVDCKGAWVIDSGVDHGNEEKAQAEILNQLEIIKSGNISDEEIENTKRSVCSAAKAVYDSAEELNSWYFERFALGDMVAPDEYCKRIQAVTKDEIIRALNSLKLDTVYTLIPKGDEANA